MRMTENMTEIEMGDREKIFKFSKNTQRMKDKKNTQYRR